MWFFKIFASFVSPIFTLLNQSPSVTSTTVSTVACGHEVEKLSREHLNKEFWNYVKVNNYTGYMEKRYLTDKKVKCLQDEYPRFFLEFDLDLTDSFYFAKLYGKYESN